MANSARANIKQNSNPNQPNQQWMPVQIIQGTTVVNSWVDTLASLNPQTKQVAIQWTADLDNLNVSEQLNFAQIEEPATHFYIVQKGGGETSRISNPNEWDVVQMDTTQEGHSARFNKWANKYPSEAFTGFASDHDIFDEAEIPGRKNKAQGASRA